MSAEVLIVEDEAAIAELLAINIRHAGMTVRVALDAEQARREVDKQLPKLVLLDWMLPGQSGVQLARQWRADERTRDLPIIMLLRLVRQKTTAWRAWTLGQTTISPSRSRPKS